MVVRDQFSHLFSILSKSNKDLLHVLGTHGDGEEIAASNLGCEHSRFGVHATTLVNTARKQNKGKGIMYTHNQSYTLTHHHQYDIRKLLWNIYQ